jgi:DNA-binding LacI/PurR family transcriptional regulator
MAGKGSNSTPRATILDVAAAAGVSPSTVSNALNDRAGVGPETASRIKRIAGELGYRANPAASRLRSGRTGALGLVLPTISEPGYAAAIYYYSRFTGSAAQAAFARGYALTLVPSIDPEQEVRRLPLDGVIVADPLAGDVGLIAFRSAGVPVVTVESDPSDPDDPWWAGADTLENTRTVLDHLAAAGSRRIALVGRSSHTWTTATDQAYERWCRERGQEPIKADVLVSHTDVEAGEQIRELLSASTPPDAILAAPEWFAIAAVRVARTMGVRVPEDLRVAAGSDGDRAYAGDPPVTALDLHPADVATAAVELLIARIEGHEVMHPRVVHASLNVRASTNPSVGRGPAPS